MVLIPALAFAQELSFDDQFVSSTEYTKLMDRFFQLENKIGKLESENSLQYFSIAIAVGSAIAAAIYFVKTRYLTKRYHGFEARQKIDELISTIEFKQMKQEVAKEYFILTKEHNKTKAILSNSSVSKQTLALEHGYNMACSWYEEEEWVDKNNFDKVYAGNVLNSWNLLSDDIFYIREKSGNKDFCKHFENVAKMYEKNGIKAPLYDLWH